jgi:hypothetical protein
MGAVAKVKRSPFFCTVEILTIFNKINLVLQFCYMYICAINNKNNKTMNTKTLNTIENFDFNALFATEEVTVKNIVTVIHSAPVKTQAKVHTCARPESCASLNALREMKNDMRIAKYKFDNKL